MSTLKHGLHRFSKAEYRQMSDLGWFDSQGVELVAGEIVDMPVPNPPHAMALGLAEDRLRRMFGPGFWVRTQNPLDLGEHSEPMPDLAVVPGGPRDYPQHPTTALLIVEISDSTLGYDRTKKARLYASAGLEDYWIVNLVDGQLEVHRDPVPDGAEPGSFCYAAKTIHRPGETVAPLALPKAAARVEDFLP